MAMTPSRFGGLLTACFAMMAGGACSGASQGSVQAAAAPQPATVAPSSPAAIAKARADSARYPYTEADVHFMSGMIAHHAQAIAMARWRPRTAPPPSIRTLAERIINAQQDEIAAMQQWLARSPAAGARGRRPPG